MHKKTANNEKDYKSRLEYKLYLARENPEPVFDISDCNLKSVPSGVYSLCKVFRKEALLLQINQLTSLSGGGNLSDLLFIKILNLNKNQLLIIPEEISTLINLEELHLSSNKLKRLPESIGRLLKLRIFDCSHNKLEVLPNSFGNCIYLTILDLRYNKNLLSIPTEIYNKIGCCKVLTDDNLLSNLPMELPNDEVAVNSTKHEDVALASSTENNNRGIEIQKSFKLFGQDKDEKLLKLLKAERNMQELKDTEFKIHSSNQNKSKLLDTLKEQEQTLDLTVMKFQTQKEQERIQLIDNLVLDNAMESLLIEENILKNSQNMKRNALLEAMEADMESQKTLVATLLKRSDLRSQNLVLQMALLQQQLAVLTAVEIERKHLYQQERASYLDDKRKTLSDLLVSLLESQEDQHKDVLDAFQNVEVDGQLCESNSNFWCQQYQRLLDEGPHKLKCNVDYDLVHEFVVNDISHYLPLIVNLDIYSLTMSQLDIIGITHSSDQDAIMKAVQAYVTKKQIQFAPSAPPPIDEASAPPAPASEIQFECVVCMERQCEIIFLPCGHYCTCSPCASMLSICPLCRAALDRKINIIIP